MKQKVSYAIMMCISLILNLSFGQIIVVNEFDQKLFTLDDINPNEYVNNLIIQIQDILIHYYNYSMNANIGFKFEGKEIVCDASSYALQLGDLAINVASIEDKPSVIQIFKKKSFV